MKIRTLFVTGWVAAVLATVSGVSAQAGWRPVAPGVAYRSLWGIVAADSVRLEVLRLRLDSVSLNVAHVYGLLETRKGQYAYSLNEVARRTSPIAAINGGFSNSFSLPSPAGLLRVSGADIAPLNHRDSIQSGVLCIQGRTLSLLRLSTYNPRSCTDAVQAGPLLVTSGRVAVRPSGQGSTGVAPRSAICVDQNRTAYLIYSQATRLHPFAVVLTDKRSRDALRCDMALNLSGGADAGMIFQTGEQVMSVGSRDTPIASAVLVVPHRRR